MSNFKLKRDAVLFYGGVIGIFHEIFIGKIERPSILMACLTMAGLDLMMKIDERRTQRGKSPTGEERRISRSSTSTRTRGRSVFSWVQLSW